MLAAPLMRRHLSGIYLPFLNRKQGRREYCTKPSVEIQTGGKDAIL